MAESLGIDGLGLFTVPHLERSVSQGRPFSTTFHIQDGRGGRTGRFRFCRLVRFCSSVLVVVIF